MFKGFVQCCTTYCNINLLHLFLYVADTKYSCPLFPNYLKTFLFLVLKGLISFSHFAVQVVKDVINDNPVLPTCQQFLPV